MSQSKLYVFVIFGSLIIDQTSSLPYGWILSPKLGNEKPEHIQYFVIVTERFAITTRFPIILYGKRDFCLETESEMNDYCIGIKNDIIYPKRDLDFAIFEIEGEFHFLFGKTSTAPLRLGGATVDLENYQFTAKLPDLTVGSAKSYDPQFIKLYPSSIHFERLEKTFKTITKDILYLNFTRYVPSGANDIMLCPHANGLPLWGDFSVVGLFSFTASSCLADMKHCAQACDYLNAQNNKLSFLNLLHKDIVAAIIKHIPDYV